MKDSNQYYWCNTGYKTSTCRWVHYNFDITGCQGSAQAIVHKHGYKGLITRALSGGCPTSAHSILSSLFRAYVQKQNQLPGNPNARVAWYLGYPIDEKYTWEFDPDVAFQDFDRGRIRRDWVRDGSGTITHVDVWAAKDDGRVVVYKRWPVSDFLSGAYDP